MFKQLNAHTYLSNVNINTYQIGRTKNKICKYCMEQDTQKNKEVEWRNATDSILKERITCIGQIMYYKTAETEFIVPLLAFL